MVSTSQIINLGLIAVGVYVAIEYGPQIITWVKSGIDKAKTELENGPAPAPGETAAPGGDTSTPFVPPEDNTQYDLGQPVQQPSGKKGKDLQLSGGTAPIKQAPTQHEITSRFEYVPTGTPGSTILQPSPIPPAKPTKKKTKKTPKAQDFGVNPSAPFESVHPTAKNLPIPTYPTVTKKYTPTLPTRFPHGSPARAQVEEQIGCHCSGQFCCYRGHDCNGLIQHECTTFANSNPSATLRNAACKSLRQRFINKNPCSKPKAPKPAVLSSRFHPKTTTKMALNPTANVGYGFGDGGQLISLDAMTVTIA